MDSQKLDKLLDPNDAFNLEDLEDIGLLMSDFEDLAGPSSSTSVNINDVTHTGHPHLSEVTLLQSMQENEVDNINLIPLENTFTFTNQLGQGGSLHEMQLLQYSEANSADFFVNLEPVAAAIEVPPEEVNNAPPAPLKGKRGRKPNPEGRAAPREKKIKMHEKFDKDHPERNTKETTRAHNARLNRENKANALNELTKERNDFQQENFLLKSQLEQRDQENFHLKLQLQRRDQEILQLKSSLEDEQTKSSQYLEKSFHLEKLQPNSSATCAGESFTATHQASATDGDLFSSFSSEYDVEENLDLFDELN